MSETLSKVCSKCGEEKGLGEYHSSKKDYLGVASRCKQCVLEYGARYYQENREKVRERNARYYQENKVRVLSRIARYHQENRERVREYKALYRQDNKEKVREKDALYYRENKESILDYQALYRRENKEKVRERKARYHQENKESILDYQARYRRENKGRIKENGARYRQENKERLREYNIHYRKRRMREDPEFRCRQLVSRQILKHLKSRDCSKSQSIVGSLPYTIAELYAHLLSTLPEGYTEQDFLDGKLHIDHIVPQSSFHFTSDQDEDFRKCWALSNLQLLPAELNTWKNNRRVIYIKGKYFAITKKKKET